MGQPRLQCTAPGLVSWESRAATSPPQTDTVLLCSLPSFSIVGDKCSHMQGATNADLL